MLLLIRRLLQLDRLPHRLLVRRVGDRLVIMHRLQDLIPPGHGMIKVFLGIIVGRPVGDGTQKGNLRQRKLTYVLVEITTARRLDTVVAIPEIDVVQIEFHDQ